MRESPILWQAKTLLGILAVTVVFIIGMVVSLPIRSYLLEQIRARRIHRTIRLYGTFAGHPVEVLRSLSF